jgi:hypothetical protein
MFCQNCGAFDTDEARFCSRCGESLSEVPGKETSSHLRTRGGNVFRGGGGFFRGLRDFQPPSLGRIRFLCKLFIPFLALFAFLFIVTGFQTSQGFGLITLLLIVALAFLFMAMCDRFILELDSILARTESHRPPAAEALDSKDQKDWIEWNIE